MKSKFLATLFVICLIFVGGADAFDVTGNLPKEMLGVYWGAFDPLTPAHQAIIEVSLKKLPLKKLYVVINNHSYKNYLNPLEDRIGKIKTFIERSKLENVELLFQSDNHPIDYAFFRERSSDPICVIAGYDSYQKWVNYSQEHERSQYDAIAVIPRGDDDPLLYDHQAFLLFIGPEYKYVSSTKMRERIGN